LNKEDNQEVKILRGQMLPLPHKDFRAAARAVSNRYVSNRKNRKSLQRN
jgi:hypothetical protein